MARLDLMLTIQTEKYLTLRMSIRHRHQVIHYFMVSVGISGLCGFSFSLQVTLVCQCVHIPLPGLSGKSPTMSPLLFID